MELEGGSGACDAYQRQKAFLGSKNMARQCSRGDLSFGGVEHPSAHLRFQLLCQVVLRICHLTEGRLDKGSVHDD